jgi:zinc/manganese transport system substrate-binding protein
VHRRQVTSPVRLGVLAAACLVAACGATSTVTTRPGTLTVVAAENTWGSIAMQLGGRFVTVSSIITNPAADPHEYEPTAPDARGFAEAAVVIENGAGYDAWAARLVAANPVAGRITVNVADTVGAHTTANPHFWYSPSDVERVAATITADYSRLDPAHAAYFAAANRRWRTAGLAGYHHAIAVIRHAYAGVSVGASESIFAPLAAALGLRLATPTGFLDAISEGTEPPLADRLTTQRQITDHAIRVWVYNTQNATPDVQRLTDQARSERIPITAITETLAPASATFQAWQTSQLASLAQALATATRR